jgi:hypothetical protein
MSLLPSASLVRLSASLSARGVRQREFSALDTNISCLTSITFPLTSIRSGATEHHGDADLSDREGFLKTITANLIQSEAKPMLQNL